MDHFLRVFCALGLLTQMTLADNPPAHLLDVDVDEPYYVDECLNERDDEQTWCPVDDILDDPKKKCWVASHTLCDGNQYVGEGSICKTGMNSAVKCVDGLWKAADWKHIRVRRGWWWGSSSGSSEETNNPPSISCPGNIQSTASYGLTSARVTWSNPTATDDGGTPSVSQTEGPASGSSFGEGTTRIKYRATDSQGATAECQFTVTVTVTYCPSLPYFWHGSQWCTGDKHNVYGSVCAHDCYIGYTLHGTRTVRCLWDGRWSDHMPSCQRSLCPALPSLSIGSRTCTGVAENVGGSVCTHDCPDGYRLEGSQTIQCLSTGTWSDLFPSCQRSLCPALPSLSIGSRTCTGVAENVGGSVCTHDCPDGYRLEGSQTIQCLSTGTWSDLFPSCQRDDEAGGNAGQEKVVVSQSKLVVIIIPVTVVVVVAVIAVTFSSKIYSWIDNKRSGISFTKVQPFKRGKY